MAYYAKECDSQGNSELNIRHLQVAEVCYSGTVNYLRFVLALVRPRLFYSSTTAREVEKKNSATFASMPALNS